jgi:hypothetical protein
LQTYPIIAAVGAALTFMTYKITHHAVYNPDVKFDKTARTSPFERSEAEGEAWLQGVRNHSRWNRPGLDVGAVSVFESWFKPEKKEGSAKVFGPTPPANA